MPIGAALTNGIVASAIVLLGVLMQLIAPGSELFWSFFALNLVLFLLSYLPVFPAFLKLRRVDPNAERPFRVPGGPVVQKIMAALPMILIVIAILFTAIPLSADAVADTLPITIGSVLCIALGELLIAARGRQK